MIIVGGGDSKEHFQHFVKDLQESFWGDLQGQVQVPLERLALSLQCGFASTMEGIF